MSPDITMCKDDRCVLKKKCYRFTAEPDYYQSYFESSPYDVEKNKCTYFMKLFDLPTDQPMEHKAIEFADKLIELILKYEIGSSVFEQAKVIIEKKHIFAEVDKKRKKKFYKQMEEVEPVLKRKPTITVSLDDGECSS